MTLLKLKGRGMEYLHREADSRIYYFRRYTRKTGEVFKSLRTKDIDEAKKKRDELLTSLDPKKKKIKNLAMDHFDEWFERKVIAGISDGTKTSIASSRAHLAPFLDLMTIEEITSTWWVSEYIKKVREKTHAKRKFFNDRKWLSSFMIAMVEASVITRAPKFVNPDQRSDIGKVFTDDEVGSLLNFAQNEDLRLAILMASTMGMRRLEIFHLACDRVDMKAKVIRLRAEDTKIRKARAFAISEVCWPLIEKRCKPGAIYVFPSRDDKHTPLHKDGFKTAWTNLRATAKVKGRFHDLRHTFLTKAFKAPGANPALICTYAGLSLDVAQRVYLHFNEKDTEAVAGLVEYE